MIKDLDDIWRPDGTPETPDETVLQGRRRYRIRIVLAIGGSYLIDTLLLFLFYLSNTVPWWAPVSFGCAGVVHVLLFSLIHWTGIGEKSANPQLNEWQMAFSLTVMLAAIALVPQLTAFFLGLIFIIFTTGTLRITLRSALWIWLLVCVATGTVLISVRAQELWIPNPGIFQASVVALSFALILLRLILLGYYATKLRLKIFNENLLLARDIAEKQRTSDALERQSQQLEKMVAEQTTSLRIAKEAAEAANRAKTAFLANMSHELRTPMSGVLGMAHLVRRGGVTPKQAEQLDKLDAAGRHLVEIINSILDLTKIEAGKMPIEAIEIDLNDITGEVASIVTPAVEVKHLELSIENPPLAYKLIGDPTRLKQALLNYASNAIKFTEQGRVILRSLVEEETADDVLIRFEVEDTGIGVDAEVADKLFHPFEQADSSTTRKYGGTGLGLVITKKLAEAMGGSAGTSSPSHVGSIFWFTVRLKKS